MTDRTTAAEAANTNPLSDEYVNAVIQQHGYDSPECVIARLHQWIGLHGGENGVTLLMYEAHKALVKLRAPVAHLGLPDVLPEFTAASGAQFVSMGTVGTVLRAARAALASAPPALDRHQLRALVDTVWNEATESTAVPDMPWADRMIDKVFSAAGASAPVAASPFMYGIMDPKGEAYFAEYCVSGAKGDLAAEVEGLNGFGTGGYQEVAMYLHAPSTPQATEAARNAALEEAAHLAEAFGQAAGRGDHFESSRYESVAPGVAKEIAKDIRARRSRQPEGQ